MKYLLLAVGIFALSNISFAEELSETGLEVLKKLRALKKEEKALLATIGDDEERDLVEETLDKEQEAEDNKIIKSLEKENKAEDEQTKDETRVKRAARRGRRGGARRRLRRNRNRARRARGRNNRRRARRNRRVKRIRALQRRRG
ncbi:unnamed protein product [Cylicocyclus nassatus]|uniref:Uncharacterized protein n=1 Tax=Cylicocyclus nassatus TaxID=53992 RepID=A0AA36H8M1_CYLNA|nr:unnamed protein product [Cylicocyclus nassatus]